MDIQYYDKPFPYVIIDNFFPQDLYERIKANMDNMQGGLSALKEAQEVREAFGTELQDIRNNLLKQVPNASDKETTPNDYIIWANRQEPFATYKNHIDSPWKRLSTVVYVGKFNSGTLFHENERPHSKVIGQVDWKENRAMSFVPSTTSFHSYKNSREYYRDTVLINMGSIRTINEAKNSDAFRHIFNPNNR